jgi:uncharacterized protein (UPF0212 family)
MRQLSVMPVIESTGAVHCPICTRAVEARIITRKKRAEVKPGQKCPRCGASLDAACVLHFDRAA